MILQDEERGIKDLLLTIQNHIDIALYLLMDVKEDILVYSILEDIMEKAQDLIKFCEEGKENEEGNKKENNSKASVGESSKRAS